MNDAGMEKVLIAHKNCFKIEEEQMEPWSYVREKDMQLSLERYSASGQPVSQSVSLASCLSFLK